MTTKRQDANIKLVQLGVAQLGSALEWGSRGRKFESSHPDHEKSVEIGIFNAFILFLDIAFSKKHTKKHTTWSKSLQKALIVERNAINGNYH